LGLACGRRRHERRRPARKTTEVEERKYELRFGGFDGREKSKRGRERETTWFVKVPGMKRLGSAVAPQKRENCMAGVQPLARCDMTATSCTGCEVRWGQGGD
jgi:hypothetical protein